MSANRYVFDIPNPKAGFAIRVIAEPSFRGERHRWSLAVYAPEGQIVGESAVFTTKFTRWAVLMQPEVQRMHRYRGYGLALYLGAALLAAKLKKLGVAASVGGLSPDSHDMWTKLHRHGLAKCDEEPAVHHHDDGMDFVALCYLHAKDVEKMIKQWAES